MFSVLHFSGGCVPPPVVYFNYLFYMFCSWNNLWALLGGCPLQLALAQLKPEIRNCLFVSLGVLDDVLDAAARVRTHGPGGRSRANTH